MKITIDDLRQLNACDEAREWFGMTFQMGGELPDVLAACKRDDWVCWYACNLSADYRYWCAGEAVASAYTATNDERLKPYVRNVTPDNWRDALKAAGGGGNYGAVYAEAAVAAAAAEAAEAAFFSAAVSAAAAARKLEYEKLRAEAERVLLEMQTAGGEATK